MKLCHRTTAKHVKGTPFLDRGSGRRAPEPEDGENPFNFSIFILFFFFSKSSTSPKVHCHSGSDIGMGTENPKTTIPQDTGIGERGLKSPISMGCLSPSSCSFFLFRLPWGTPGAQKCVPVHGLKFSERHWFYSQRARKKDPLGARESQGNSKDEKIREGNP